MLCKDITFIKEETQVINVHMKNWPVATKMQNKTNVRLYLIPWNLEQVWEYNVYTRNLPLVNIQFSE